MGSSGREEVDASGQMWVGRKALVEVCMCVCVGGTCRCKQQRGQPKPCGLCRGKACL